MTDFSLAEVVYWVNLLAVIVSSASGVIKAGFKRYDLFGVIIIALATALGGGSLRDMLLDRPVFWIADQIVFIVSIGSAFFIFFAARIWEIPLRYFLIADAAGLATFAVAGTSTALLAGAPWLIASFMGVMTGTMGGVFRDLLCNESPVVFHSPLYATVSWGGSLVFIVMLHWQYDTAIAAIVAGMTIFVLRLLALKFDINLPKFRFKADHK